MRLSIRSFAKINLDLRVLNKRPDGFHELRTIFQTISLHDGVTVEYEPRRTTRIEVESSVNITENIAARAASQLMDAAKSTGHVRIAIEKRIPMGAGLGGGSSNAAATLLALNSLIKKKLELKDLLPIAGCLGSDVPLFLYGGTLLGLGRGTELYPLPDFPAHHGIIVASGIHVSTAEAYKALNRRVAESTPPPEFLDMIWHLGSELSSLPLHNDFAESVYERHPELAQITRKLRRLGACPAMMTGSGSAIFGLFASRGAALEAAKNWPANASLPFRLLSRARYQRMVVPVIL